MREPSRLRRWTALAVGGCLAVSGCAGVGPREDAETLEEMEPIELIYSESNVETAAHVQAMQTFMDEVTEKTDGKITFKTYYAEALHPLEEGISSIQSGLTDITFVSASNAPDQLPVGVWEAELAQGTINPEFPQTAIEGTPVQFAAYQSGLVEDELAKYDATSLVTWSTAPNNLLCKPRVGTASDAAGNIVRTPGPPFSEEVNELGMSNVFMPVADVYEAMQRGVIDCFMNVVSPFITLSMWDEAKYFVPGNFATSVGSQLLMNKSVLESMPLEVQQIFFDARVDLLAGIMEKTVASYVKWAEEAPAKGVEFIDPTPFNTAIDAARAKYTEEAQADPPEGVDDAEGFADELSSLAAGWRKAATGLDVESGSPTTEEGWVDLYKASGEIDWDAYREALHEYLAAYRPE